MKLVVVIDTNVFISGIFWQGNHSSKVLDAWRNNKIILITSNEILEEFTNTLASFKIRMAEDMIKAWEKEIRESALIVTPKERLNITKHDPDDNKFFEAAIEGDAHYIISQDKKHILSIKEFAGVRTISPEGFLSLIE